jgi:hypothetical protein
MTNKLKKQQKEYYHYNELCKLVETISGRDIRDWAGKFKNRPTANDYAIGNFPEAIWAKSQGYKWEVLNDYPDGSRRPEEEIKLRIKIIEEYKLHNKEYELPYQDFWHYAMDRIFYDVSNGVHRFFNPGEHLEYIKDENLGKYEFVKEILPYFIQVFKENDLPEEIEVCISW